MPVSSTALQSPPFRNLLDTIGIFLCLTFFLMSASFLFFVSASVSSNWMNSAGVVATSLTIKGAGIESLDGVYHMVGHCNGTGMYSKQGTWDDCNIKFTLFRCHLANSERMWFISIVPDGIKPGTDEDKDFYVAPEIGQTKTPPEEGWVAIRPYGVQPAPVCLFDAPEPTKKAAIVSHEVLNIHSAGSEEVNGFYHRTGIFDNVGMYTRTAPWGVSTDTKLTIFRSVGSEGHRGRVGRHKALWCTASPCLLV